MTSSLLAWPHQLILTGCIFAELYAGRALFPGKNHNDQLWLVMKGVGRLTEHQIRLLRKSSQLNSFRQPLPHEHTPIEARCVCLGLREPTSWIEQVLLIQCR